MLVCLSSILYVKEAMCHDVHPDQTKQLTEYCEIEYYKIDRNGRRIWFTDIIQCNRIFRYKKTHSVIYTVPYYGTYKLHRSYKRRIVKPRHFKRPFRKHIQSKKIRRAKKHTPRRHKKRNKK